MSVKRMICNFCYSEIAKFDTATIKLPLTPDMFKSYDEKHGIPAPFPKGQKAWMDFRCPVCLLRPQEIEKEIACYDTKGFNDTFIVGKAKIYQCDICNQEFDYPIALFNHKKKCEALDVKI